MNGENNHIFHTSALDGEALAPQPRYAWSLFAVKLCVLAAFVGMSLIAKAATQVIDGNGPIGAVLAFAGTAIIVAAWRGANRCLRAAERAEVSQHRSSGESHPPLSNRTARPAIAHPRITGITPSL